VVTNREDLARRISLFVNKAWAYGDAQPDHEFIALNGRMSELQGAVAVAQLEKLDGIVAMRQRLAESLTRRIAGLPGVRAPQVDGRATHVYWKYALRVDAAHVPGGAVALGRSIAARGIACAPRYIQKPAFECAVIRDQRTFGKSRWPFTLARPDAVDYSRQKFPGTYRALDEVLVLPWNERYDEEHVAFIAGALFDGVHSAREAAA
jgi:perosamine synthetase